MIYFLKDTSSFILPDKYEGKNIIVTYREGFGYQIPKIDGAEYIEFEKYKVTYVNYNPDLIIIIGLNRIIVPQNRCDFIFEYLYTNTTNIPKISIDNEPFIGEPWRLWFHYGLCYTRWLGFNYSYVVETDWQHWFYRDAEHSIIEADAIKDNLLDMMTDLDRKECKFTFREPTSNERVHYEEIKEYAFEKYKTPKLIIITMSKELNKMIDMDIDFDTYRLGGEYTLPDFPIYRFIAEENRRRMDIYNLFAK